MAVVKTVEPAELHFTFTEGKVNPSCHLAVATRFVEDGVVVASSRHRHEIRVDAPAVAAEISDVAKEAVCAAVAAAAEEFGVWSATP